MRAAYVVLPLLAACGASALLVRVPALAGAAWPVRWALVLGCSTLVLVAAHRSLARLLPLAALLELSVQFPGPAPSRYVVARDSGNSGKLVEIVARAQRGDPLVDLADAEAARDILALVGALRSHDTRTRGHSERVRVFTDLIGEQLRLDSADREQLRWAALLHDVGKLNVPAAVLNKTEKLDESDWRSIRSHPANGARITAPLHLWLGSWADTIAQHHEKYDGTGYPLGLSAEQICLGARIVAVADAFDVMTAARSYRKPIGREAALRELTSCSGSHFDPRVVRAMLAVSTPRLRIAMGPLSWLGSSPFLAASQGAASVVTQATAGALVAGAVVVSGPAAIAGHSPTPTTPSTTSTTSIGPTHAGTGHHGVATTATASQSPHPGASPTAPVTRPSGPPTVPPGKPSKTPRPTTHGHPTKTPKPHPTKTTTPAASRQSGSPKNTPKP